MQNLIIKDELFYDDVVLEVYSSTCIPCKKQLKILDALELSGRLPNVKFFKIESGSVLGVELINQYNLYSAPSILCFRNGSVLQTFTKLTMPDEFVKVFNS